MKLSEDRFSGPHTVLVAFTYDRVNTYRKNCTFYTYETEKAIFDVVIPESPIGPDQTKRWYKINGASFLVPHTIHKAIERRFDL